MPWWLVAIIFFCLGSMTQRWVLDRQYLKEVRRLSAKMQAMTKSPNGTESEEP